MKLEFSAGAIVVKVVGSQFYFALTKDSDDRWSFPKGHIEKKEKPEIAARREIGEEIGVSDLETLTKLAKIDYFFKREDELIHKFVYFYLMKTSPEATLIPQEGEIFDAQWLTYADALKTVDFKKHNLPLLKKANELLQSPEA